MFFPYSKILIYAILKTDNASIAPKQPFVNAQNVNIERLSLSAVLGDADDPYRPKYYIDRSVSASESHSTGYSSRSLPYSASK